MIGTAAAVKKFGEQNLTGGISKQDMNLPYQRVMPTDAGKAQIANQQAQQIASDKKAQQEEWNKLKQQIREGYGNVSVLPEHAQKEVIRQSPDLQEMLLRAKELENNGK